MEEEDAVSKINFISCVCFIRQGVATAHPEKITLNTKELTRIINETKQAIQDQEEDEDEEGGENNEDESMDTDENQQPQATRRNGDDEFDFANYDNEDNAPLMGIGDVVVLDPNEDLADDENDSEAEDDEIKKSDNLILVGHVEDHSVSMEVYVWNESEGSLYVHHDFLLPSHPLCLEWLNRDPGSSEDGNLCAIGTMDPVITVWDLDIQDSLEPAFQLGSKGNRKKKVPKVGHRDAVLDLSWNEEFCHVLASGSVDQTVLLWDIDQGVPQTTISAFEEKVQCVKFHPTEPYFVLTGVCDGSVKLFDCREENSIINSSFKLWRCDGDVEKLLWDPLNSNHFVVGSLTGKMYYFDRRMDATPVWMKLAHDQEISGMAFNKKLPGMLTTSSTDGTAKIWKYDANEAHLVQLDDLKIGRVLSMSSAPESPNILAFGGDNKQRHFRVVNVLDYDAVRHNFSDVLLSAMK